MMRYFTELGRAVETLEMLDCAAQTDFLLTLEIEGAGSFKKPDTGNNWDNQLFEITLYGVSASGPTQSAAIMEWSKAAKRQIDHIENFEVARATIMGERGAVPTDTMIAACETIMTSTRVRNDGLENHALYQAATQLHRTLKLDSSEAA